MKKSMSSTRNFNFNRQPNIPNQQDWLVQIETIIEDNISNPQLGVDFLVKKASSSRNKFFIKMKSLTGLTPNQYIRKIRLKIAKELLENHQYRTLNEVAHHVGFSRADYFSKLFVQEYGENPMAYLRG